MEGCDPGWGIRQCKKQKRETAVSPGLITFVLHMMYKHLTREQRYTIYLGLQNGDTLEKIASFIGVHKSTVSREVRRNSTANGKYVWTKAHAKAESRQRHAPGNRRPDEILKWSVVELIRNEQWSPRQTSGRLRREGTTVSHETVSCLTRGIH